MKFIDSLAFPHDLNILRKYGRRFTGKYGHGYLLEDTESIKFTISIPKKKIKLAVNRNLIRRRFVSAVREILKDQNKKFHIFYIYNFSDILPFEKINKELEIILIKK